VRSNNTLIPKTPKHLSCKCEAVFGIKDCGENKEVRRGWL